MSYNNKILSIDSNDDNDNYSGFTDFLNEDTIRKKKKTISEIEENGDNLLSEIDKKRKVLNKRKEKYVPYILKHSDDYDKEELLSYEMCDVVQIYEELKERNKSAFKKIFEFLFNI